MTLIKCVVRLLRMSVRWTYAGLAAVGGLVALCIGVVQFGYGVTMGSPFHIFVGACVMMAGGQAMVAYFGSDVEEEDWTYGGLPAAEELEDDGREVGGVQEEGAPWGVRESGA